jgi:hypothetical protein
MEEENLILLAQEIARQQQPMLDKLSSIDNRLTKLGSIDDTLKKQNLRANKSQTLTVDLTKVHTNEPLNIEYEGRTYLWLTIEKADSPFTYKLGQTSGTKSEPFTGAVGANLLQHEFTEVYLTNAVAVGHAVIVVGWRE